MDHLFTQRRTIVNAISKKKRLIKQMIKNGIKNNIKMNKLCNSIKKLKKNRNKMNRKIKQKERNLAKKHGESIEELINEAAFKDDKLLYKIYNKLSSSRPIKIKQLRDKKTKEIIANNNQSIADRLVIHFNKKIKRNDYNKDALLYHKNVKKRMNQYQINNKDCLNVLNRPFTIQEVTNRINKLNLLSAMAWDFIHYKAIHIAKSIIVPRLVKIFNALFCKHQFIPHIWRYSEYIPAPKPGRDCDYEENSTIANYTCFYENNKRIIGR